MKISKGERTRALILEATAHCVANEGIENTSITRIAKQARVSRGLVAHYFPRKAKIFSEVIRFIIAQAYEVITVEPYTDPYRRLAHIFQSNLDFFLRRPDYIKCFMLFYYLAGVEAPHRRLNTKLTKVAQDRIAKELRALNIKTSPWTEIFHGQLVGAILKFHTHAHAMNAETYRNQFLANLALQVSLLKVADC